ncbi:predicted protein [Chaetoceros tenuissimus]|uniref:Uncharacterized protein n=1 Tax=Chaetoceros tenuissimus TaxID=426638 RepID=A0AAD3D5R1_9STRA|nr:predicted protein [Chaetoceros tenuissimus]
MRLKYSPFDKSPERGISLQEADDQQPSSSAEVEGHQEHTSSSSNTAQNLTANETTQGQTLLVLNLPQDEDSSMSNLTVSTNGIVSTGNDTSLHASQISCSLSTLFTKENEVASNENDDISVASQVSDGDLVIISPSRASSKARSTEPREMIDTDSISTSKKDFSPSTLQAIGQSLIVEDEESTVCSEKVKESTEEKWSEEQLQAAKEIFPFLESNQKPKKRYPLPPLPSSEEYDFDLVISQEEKDLSEKFLSDEFICHLCNGPVVGAAMYSCSCNKCACIMCIEKESNTEKMTLEVGQHKCDSCLTSISSIPCAAMDKAILTVISVMDTLSSQHDNVDIEIVKSFQARYYARLREWYKEAVRRNHEMDHEEELEKMKLLNEYAKYESDHFKRLEEEETKTLKDAFVDSTFLVGAMVAPIIVFGVRAILRK